MKKAFYLAAIALVMGFFTACSDDDDNKGPEIVNPSPKEQWGETMRGDNQSIKGYPDIFANYWEYTYKYGENKNIGLRITGNFPKARFFNFTVYNDVTQIDVSSIEDVNIKPNDKSVNPYVTATENYGENEYTIYVIPASTPAAQRTAMKNICEFPDSLQMVSIFLRTYLAQQYSNDALGGVEMPAIQAFDVTTGKDVEFPKREACKIHEGANMPPMDFSSDVKSLRFMLAPLTLLYPNRPAQYLFTRIKLNEGEVATFRFIPPVAPASVTDYPTADVRYWSICLGGADALAYYSSYDTEMPKRDKDGFITIIIADKNSAKYADIQKKAAAIDGTYVLPWDLAKWGSGVLALYRNMVINPNYEYSMSELMTPPSLNPGAGTPSMEELKKMIAMLAMGNWGPQGYKFTEAEYLSDDFNYALIRRMQ